METKLHFIPGEVRVQDSHVVDRNQHLGFAVLDGSAWAIRRGSLTYKNCGTVSTS